MAQRVLGDVNVITLKMRTTYTQALFTDTSATLDDLREAVETLEETVPTARRVFGGAHPPTKNLEDDLQISRAALAYREKEGS